MANIKDFLGQTKTVDGWFVVKVFLAGAFCGAVLAVTYMWVAVVSH